MATVDMKEAAKRWGNRDFNESVESALSSAVYEYPFSERLAEITEDGNVDEVTGIEVGGKPYETEEGVHITVRIKLIEAVRMYGVNHPESREGEMELLLDLKTGEADVKSCSAVSGDDE